MRVGDNRQQSSCEFARLQDRIIHELHNPGGVGSLWDLPFCQLLFLHLRHESNPGEVLPQSIMQVLSDSPLLAFANVQDRLLQPLTLADVANRARNQHSFFRLQGAQAYLYGKLMSILVQRVQL